MALEMKELLATLPQIGEVEWIGLRPARREPPVLVKDTTATMTGLEGDRFSGKPNAKRMVTLIQREHLDVVASLLGELSIDPSLLRRNIVVARINLQALKQQHLQIGEAVFYGTGNCPPCSRMEENLGEGGYNAMRGHGGITATVIHPGKISIGDAVKFLPRYSAD